MNVEIIMFLITLKRDTYIINKYFFLHLLKYNEIKLSDEYFIKTTFYAQKNCIE